MRTVHVILSLLVLVMATGCAATAPPSPEPLEQIRLPMGYIPNVQFAPFYVAVEKGYFADENIELEFDYSFETDGIKLVGAGELPFTLGSGEQVPLARNQGLPVTYVLQWWQRFPVVIVSLAKDQITEPSALNGKTIGTPIFGGASYIGWEALIWKAGLDESSMNVQDIGYTQVAALIEGKVDAAVCYINNEPVQLEQAGYDIDLIYVSDYANLVSNGLITSEEIINNRPDLVQAMLRAFLRGLEDTIDDPDGAFDICQKYIDGLGKDEDATKAQRQVLASSIELWTSTKPGQNDPAAWQMTLDVLKQMDLLSDDLATDNIYTNQFVDELAK